MTRLRSVIMYITVIASGGRGRENATQRHKLRNTPPTEGSYRAEDPDHDPNVDLVSCVKTSCENEIQTRSTY